MKTNTNRRKNIKFSEWIDIWLQSERPFIKESTYATYTNIIENHIKPSLGTKNINCIKNDDLQNTIFKKLNSGKLNNRKGLSLKTVRDIMTVTRSCLNFAMKKGIIKRKVFEYKFPKNITGKKIEIFTHTEQSKLFEYIISNLDEKSLGILISLLCGLRIGEICGLKWCDIDFKNEMLSVNRTIQRIYFKKPLLRETKIIISSPKTDSSYRNIPLNSPIIKIMKKFQKEDTSYLISGNENFIEPRIYRKYFYSILSSLNISKLPFHSLRHTFATQAIELGTDYKTVSEILGHSSVNTTLNLYVHPKMEYKKKCLSLIYQELSSSSEKIKHKTP
jgi:site-specific recombinase, phage integrase family